MKVDERDTFRTAQKVQAIALTRLKFTQNKQTKQYSASNRRTTPGACERKKSQQLMGDYQHLRVSAALSLALGSATNSKLLLRVGTACNTLRYGAEQRPGARSYSEGQSQRRQRGHQSHCRHRTATRDRQRAGTGWRHKQFGHALKPTKQKLD